MKTLMACLLMLAAAAAHADDTTIDKSESTSPWLSPPDTHPYSQVFTLQAGLFHPAAVSLSNSNFRYDYQGQSLNTYLVEPGWSIKLFAPFGAFYLEEGLFFTTIKGTLPAQSDSLSLFMIGVDTRLKYAMEWFPLRAVIPFVEGGYQYTFYAQSGPSDFESAQGSVGNIVGGAGIDLWINAMLGQSNDSVTKYSAIPLFLTAKVNRIEPGNGDVNLSSTTYMAGLSVGL